MKHRIVIRCEGRSLRDFALKQQISKCITAALAHQGVNTPCEINVLVTDDAGIRAINNAYRKIDRATDVLSFPMFELTAGQLPASWEAYKDPDTGLVPLGDMAISLERARQQAAEFGHHPLHSASAGLRPCGRRADEKADACRRRGHSGRN